MNDFSAIDGFLATFITYIDSGFGLISGDVTSLAAILIVIDVTLAALFWAWGQNDILQSLVKKTLYVGAFAFIFGNFAMLSTIVFDSFATLGLNASAATLLPCRSPEAWPRCRRGSRGLAADLRPYRDDCAGSVRVLRQPCLR
jgi:type IV secretory pathway TrbL component